jgi:hypothetical protein
MVQGFQCIGESRQAFARNPSFVLPFGKLRKLAERRIHRLADQSEAKAFGQRIDRLDQRQRRQPGLIHDAIGMHHLQHAVEQGGGTGDVTQGAFWIELFQIIPPRIEIGENESAGVVGSEDAVRRARTVRRRWLVVVDRHRHRDDCVRHDVAQLRPRPPVDGAGWQMEQQIGHARNVFAAPEQAGVKLLLLRPDAGQAGQRGEQRIEQVGAHRSGTISQVASP